MYHCTSLAPPEQPASPAGHAWALSRQQYVPRQRLSKQMLTCSSARLPKVHGGHTQRPGPRQQSTPAYSSGQWAVSPGTPEGSWLWHRSLGLAVKGNQRTHSRSKLHSWRWLRAVSARWMGGQQRQLVAALLQLAVGAPELVGSGSAARCGARAFAQPLWCSGSTDRALVHQQRGTEQQGNGIADGVNGTEGPLTHRGIACCLCPPQQMERVSHTVDQGATVKALVLPCC